MKLKRLPEDFRVDEELAFTPSAGPYRLYRLKKRSLGTLEAIAAIARQWKLPRAAIAFAGLKDKHALTTQYITIHRGPGRGLKQTNLELTPVANVDRPIHASDIKHNRFQVVLRDLTAGQASDITATLARSAVSFPNYFDNQRFGSVGQSGGYIALPWCRGDYERAIWLALTDPNEHDTSAVRAEKQFIARHWGDWRICHERFRSSPYAAVLGHLATQPTDFRRAIARAPHELRSLWLAAFQSHLWNQILATLLCESISEADLAWRAVGGHRLPFFSRAAALPSEVLPLPSARLHLEDERLAALYQRSLAAEGLELRQLRVKYPRDSFFSKGERPTVITAAVQSKADEDELHAERKKLSLRFALPRGTYATMLIKQLAGDHSLSGSTSE